MKRTSSGITLALLITACGGTAAPTGPDAADSVRVIRVLDGDSLLVERDGAEAEVRLLGINTPERDECFHGEARSRTTELAAGQVRLTGDGEDRFGRLLRYAYAGDGTLINQQLIEEGFALALTTDHPLVGEFKAAEATAFQQRIGRWQPVTCGPATGASVSIGELQHDAPGDDAQNRNGEWIDVDNRGPGPAALDGWVVRDESSSHRFEFPGGFILAAGSRVRISSGCGEPTADHLFWCDDGPIWNNQGDTAYLLDASGNVVDRFAF